MMRTRRCERAAGMALDSSASADSCLDTHIIFGRTKYRKQPTYRAPWTTVTAGGEMKPRETLSTCYGYWPNVGRGTS
eukprot:2428435-Amphidinium_carterae.1